MKLESLKMNIQPSVFRFLPSVFRHLSSVFMQNKPNVKDAKMNLNSLITSKYEKMDNWLLRKTNPIKPKTKPKQTQFVERPKMIQSNYLQRVMMIKPYCGFVKTKPIKANIEAQRKSRLFGNQSSLITIEAQRKSRPLGNQSSLITIEAQRKSRPLGNHLEGKAKQTQSTQGMVARNPMRKPLNSRII